MLSRALIACLLAAALCGCGAGASFFGPSTGTVTGHVQLRVCGGAYRPEQTSCPARPMVDATIKFALAGASSSSAVTTDSAGAYRIDLKPGTYTVRATEGGPGTVTVVAGQTVTKDFSFTIQMQ